MSFRPHSERLNRNRLVHLVRSLNAYTTLCGRDANRTQWAKGVGNIVPARVTCPKCRELADRIVSQG